MKALGLCKYYDINSVTPLHPLTTEALAEVVCAFAPFLLALR
jgi:hypothetical protein